MSDGEKRVFSIIEGAEVVTRGPGARPPTGDDPDLPPGCAVRALGVRGDVCFFLDANGQLRGVKVLHLGRLTIISLFGHRNGEIAEHWPRGAAKDGKVDKADYDLAAHRLIAAASRKGVFDPATRLRGRGAWLGEDGELALHLGDVVLMNGRELEPGEIGGRVYATDAPLARPWPREVAGGAEGPGDALLGLFGKWRLRRRDLDARLLLGWIACAMMGGALQWRPHLWVTGAFGTGKSTLLSVIADVFAGGLLKTSDASAAGIWQALGHAALPCLIDEAEAEEDNRRAQGTVKLARQASSGGLVVRGSADHAGAEFTVLSCFLFSSTLLPPLLPQDRSRLAVIELEELGRGAAPLIEPRRLRETGRQLLRRVIDGWPRWRDTLAGYHAALTAGGHSARSADVFASLLAGADIALHDGEFNADFAADLADRLAIGSLAEAEDAARDEERCLQFLLTLTVPPEASATKQSIGAWIDQIVTRDSAKKIRLKRDDDAAFMDRVNADRVLGRFGLKVIADGDATMLAVASAHAELGKLFAGTRWAGRAGTIGVWTQTLRRLPGARALGRNLWFAGASAKATVLPIELAVAADDGDKKPDRRPAQLAMPRDAGDDE